MNKLLQIIKHSSMQIVFALIFSSISIAAKTNGQEILDQPVTIQCHEQKLGSVLNLIEENTGVKFVFSSKLIQSSRMVTINVRQEKLVSVLSSLLNPMKIGYQVNGNKIILNRKADTKLAFTTNTNNTAIEEPINGKVVDNKGEELIGVSVTIKGTTKGTTTNAEGSFSLNANTGDVLVFSYVGYTIKELKIIDNQTINVVLEENAALLSEVIVTGTRSVGRTKIDTPVPVDVIPLSQVTNSVGQVDINQILTFVAPSFQSSRQAISDGTDHVDPAQLRGLGPDQVLVLVNGKRRHQSALVNVNGTVNRGTVGTDMNAIPATSVEKIEILRDGAAAQYGSDAIAGVINIILKKQIGLSGNISGGQHITSYEKDFAISNGVAERVKANDGQTGQIGLNYGFKLGKKGFVNITGEYVSRVATNRTGTYTGQVFPAVVGKTDNQVIAEAGLTRNTFDMRIGNSQVKGGGIVINAALPINDKLEVYAFGGYNNKKGNAAGFYRYPNAVPAAIRTNVFTVYPKGFLPEINTDVTDVSFSAGLRGKVFSDWNLDLSNTYGKNTFDYGVDNSVNYTQAFETGSFQRKFKAGGNSFSQNTINLDLNHKYDNLLNGLNVAFGAEQRTDEFGTEAGEEASYKNFNTAAGVAVGSQVFGGFLPSNAGTKSRNSFGLYTDLELDITKAWVITGALRFEKYSNFSNTPLNYKLATRYKLTDNIAIRGAISTGFRAPSLQQSYYAKTNTLFVTIAGVQTPVESGTFTNDSKAATILGIPTLNPETSKNLSIGATAQLGKLELTVDAYQINIKDRIILTNNFTGNGNVDLIAQLSAAGATTVNFFTNAIDTRSRGLEAVASYSTRVGSNQSLKFIVAGAFINNQVIKGANGKVAIKASQKLIDTGQLGNYFNREDQSRIEVASPKSKITGTINYKIAKLGFMLRAVYFGEVVYLDPTINSETNFVANTFAFGSVKETLDQTFTPKITTDLTANYQFTKNLNFVLGANNLFDVYQDIHKHSANMGAGRFVYSRRVQQFGFNGRYVFGRLSFNF
jgi:iron complex outermembrane recepter protein